MKDRKKSKRKTKRDSIRNLVRGAISSLKAPTTPKAKTEHWQREQLASFQVNKAISLAKSSGMPLRPAEMADWARLRERGYPTVSDRLGRPLTSLGLLPTELVAGNLANELRLAGDRISSCLDSILAFCDFALKVDEQFQVKNWTPLLENLDELARQHDHSYWEIELRLATVQASSGIEALKKNAQQLSSNSGGANRFLLHYLGVRNEPAQSPVRFKENLKRRLEESPLLPPIRSYFAYRLYGDLSLDERHLAAVLAAEQLTTEIDLVFTSLKVAAAILQTPSAFSEASRLAANDLFKKLKPIAEKLHFSAEGVSLSAYCESEIIDSDATTRAREAYTSSPSDLGRLARAAIYEVLCPTAPLHFLPIKPVLQEIVDGVVSRLSTRGDGIAAQDLAKLQSNFNGIPTLLQIGDVATIEQLPSILATVFQRGKDGPAHASSLGDALISATQIALQANFDNTSPTEYSTQAALTNAAAHFWKGEHGTAIQRLSSATTLNVKEEQLDALFVLMSRLQIECGDSTGALTNIATAGLRNERLVALLPLSRLFQGARWAALRSLGPSVELSICLELYLRTFDDSKLRSYKRYSIEELLTKYKCRTLRKLLEKLLADGGVVAHLEYLFSSVCDVYTMELLPGIRNSKRVLVERMELLRELAKLNTPSRAQHTNEALNIEESLSVNDGLAILDDTRVYADKSRLLNAIIPQLAADFQRYKNLVSAGIGASESFAEFLRGIKNPTAKTFHIPKNDADDLLGEIVYQIREKFLFDAAYGLDIHLSRRIRHGTISSQLRGPLEAAGMIGQRPSAGADYDPPEEVVRHCANVDAKVRERAFAAFSRFSDAIDQLIARLRDEYFQIHDQTKPRGLFELALSAFLLNLARGIGQSCDDITEFAKECIALFWFALSQRLPMGRRNLERDSKRTLQTIFKKLMQELVAAGMNDIALHARAKQLSEELTNRVSVIGSWIRVPNINIEGKTYAMQKTVDISVAVITGQRPGYKPVVSSSVPDDLLLDTHGYSMIVDMLYIALDNVCQHSEKKVGNEIHISVTLEKEKSKLQFTLTSQVGAGARTQDKETRLEEIRAKIIKRAFGASARTEGRSGLLKLAALVHQSKTTEISFGFVGDDQFELRFSLEFVSMLDGAGVISVN